MKENKNTYMICSISSDEGLFYSAYLLKVKFLEESPDIIVRKIRTTTSSWKFSSIEEYSKLKFFTIEGFIARASDGTSKKLTKNTTIFDEEKELFNKNDFLMETHKHHNIHFSYKLNKGEKAIIDSNKIWCTQEYRGNLLFKEKNDEDAISKFKMYVEDKLYFGVLNEDIYINSNLDTHNDLKKCLVSFTENKAKRKDYSYFVYLSDTDGGYLKSSDILKLYDIRPFLQDRDDKLDIILRLIGTDLEKWKEVITCIKNFNDEVKGLFLPYIQIPDQGPNVPIKIIPFSIISQARESLDGWSLPCSLSEFILDDRYCILNMMDEDNEKLFKIRNFISNKIQVKPLWGDKIQGLKDYLNENINEYNKRGK